MGKSTLAQRVLKERGIAYVSTDGLTVMLKPEGLPSFYSPKKAELFFPYLDAFISRMVPIGPDYLIEGDSFSPEHVVKLKNKYQLRCIFTIMPEISVTSMLSHTQHDKWTNEYSKDHLEGLVKRIKAASESIRQDCLLTGIPCYDLSHDYDSTINEAYHQLMSDD